jgi:BirA family biotin operon repressor/biotin-[acetyl-CoA-carboxylase] ligase
MALSEQAIRAYLSPSHAQNPQCAIHILDTVDSTNTYLLTQAKQGVKPLPLFCLTQQQTAGRGRDTKRWHMGKSGNIALSGLWCFPEGAQTLNGLSLIAGLAVAEAVQRMGANHVGVKWPNDVLWQAKQKLAGIAVEVSMNHDICHAVIGVGLNIHLSDADHRQILALQAKAHPTPPADLTTLMGKPVNSNQVVALLIETLLHYVSRFKQTGLAGFEQAWQKQDILRGRAIDVHTINETVSGTMCGIDEKGRLILATPTGQQHFYMGEVSVRPSLPSK